jgi:hypothetical protein
LNDVSPPARTGFESLQPHQTLDPVQAARHTLGGKITPYPPGAIGWIAAEEACPYLGAELVIVTAALAARPGQQA